MPTPPSSHKVTHISRLSAAPTHRLLFISQLQRLLSSPESPVPSQQNLHVYISEHEHFTDFNATSALFWEQHDLVYGDWTSGENSDGCYEHFAELDIPQVGIATDSWPQGCVAHADRTVLELAPGPAAGA